MFFNKKVCSSFNFKVSFYFLLQLVTIIRYTILSLNFMNITAVHFVKDFFHKLFFAYIQYFTYLIVLWTISLTLGGQCNNLSLSCCKTTIATYPTSPTFGIGSENVPPILDIWLFAFFSFNGKLVGLFLEYVNKVNTAFTLFWFELLYA